MDSQQWIARCSARLHAQWPTVPEEQLVEVAAEIQSEVQRQLEAPELAAIRCAKNLTRKFAGNLAWHASRAHDIGRPG